MLLPSTLPTAMSPLPLKAAWTLTAASGALVPKATTVSPIASGDSRCARQPGSAAYQASAPITSSTRPRRERRKWSVTSTLR